MRHLTKYNAVVFGIGFVTGMFWFQAAGYVGGLF